MRYSLKISLAFLLVFLVTSFAITNSAVDRVSTNRSVSLPNKKRHEVIVSLPSIKDFHQRPSDRFLVDLEVVRRGHPYKGRRAERPHTGGHVYFNVQDISGSAKQSRNSRQYMLLLTV